MRELSSSEIELVSGGPQQGNIPKPHIDQMINTAVGAQLH